jgi:glycosyltransferase involved in cell wall biosynthesis
VRVLLCVPAFTPANDFGGPVTKVRLLARGLDNFAVDTEILAANFGARRSRIAPGRRSVDGIAVTYTRRVASRGWLSISTGVKDAVRRGKFDVVHCFGLRDGTVGSCALFAHRSGTPVVLEPMGMAVPRLRNLRVKHAFDRTVGSVLSSTASIVIATSDLEAHELRAIGYGNVVIRANPVDNAECRTVVTNPEYDFCFIGRLHAKKQLTVFVDLLERLPSARVVVAGPDEDGSGESLRKAAVARGVANRLEIRGWVSEAERAELLDNSKCFVLPSLTENFGNAAAEAMARGVAVAVTDECGIAPFVTKSGAGVVTSTNPKQIVAGVEALINDERRLRTARINARAAVEPLSVDAVASRQADIYREALKQHA